MKQAIWKVAPFGEFAFRGTRSTQLTLGLENVDFRPLKRAYRKALAARDGYMSRRFSSSLGQTRPTTTAAR